MLWCQWLTGRVTWDLLTDPSPHPPRCLSPKGSWPHCAFWEWFWVHMYTTELWAVSMGSGMQFITLIFPWPLVEAVPFPVLLLQLLSHLPKHWLQVRDKIQSSSSPWYCCSLQSQSHFQVWFQPELISPHKCWDESQRWSERHTVQLLFLNVVLNYGRHD